MAFHTLSSSSSPTPPSSPSVSSLSSPSTPKSKTSDSYKSFLTETLKKVSFVSSSSSLSRHRHRRGNKVSSGSHSNLVSSAVASEKKVDLMLSHLACLGIIPVPADDSPDPFLGLVGSLSAKCKVQFIWKKITGFKSQVIFAIKIYRNKRFYLISSTLYLNFDNVFLSWRRSLQWRSTTLGIKKIDSCSFLKITFSQCKHTYHMLLF